MSLPRVSAKLPRILYSLKSLKHRNLRLSLLLWAMPLPLLHAQGSAPVFQQHVGSAVYTMAGQDPARGGSTTLPVTLVPVTLQFAAEKTRGRALVLNAGNDVQRIVDSPIFHPFPFPTGGDTQYADALLRSTFPNVDPNAKSWHTLLGHPAIQPVTVTVPAGNGYVLTSHRDGGLLGVVDADFLEHAIFAQIGPKHAGLVLAFTHNTTYYADGDATICCSTGTHGVDPGTGDSFVLGSYFHDAPAIVGERDVQPLTEQLAEFVMDPLHNPQHYGYNVTAPGNAAPAWRRPAGQGGCGGTGIASSYFLLEPTDTNRKNNIPASPAFAAQAGSGIAHLQNVALLPWYTGAAAGSGRTLSFPDPHALAVAAQPCAARGASSQHPIGASAVAAPGDAHGHRLIGYWTGHGPDGAPFPLRDVSSQWNTVIVAFASPVKDAPEGTLRFRLPRGIDAAGFKADVAALQRKGRKVLISLGGGGAYFTLADAKQVPYFVSCVADIVRQYGFDGVDIDFETPSLALGAGDADFRHPTTPSVVNLIAALRQLQSLFGPRFMLSLVPEGPQLPAGHLTYGGQFGSYLPLVYGLRDILSFVDVQDYNTPPLEGLDGEIYQTGSVDYHAAMTELLLHGFPVGGDAGRLFPPLPAQKVAVGFLVDYTPPAIASGAMRYLLTGKSPAGSSYALRRSTGYPDLRGAMFWTIDEDRSEGLRYSNLLGPQLHRNDAGKQRRGEGNRKPPARLAHTSWGVIAPSAQRREATSPPTASHGGGFGFPTDPKTPLSSWTAATGRGYKRSMVTRSLCPSALRENAL